MESVRQPLSELAGTSSSTGAEASTSASATTGSTTAQLQQQHKLSTLGASAARSASLRQVSIVDLFSRRAGSTSPKPQPQPTSASTSASTSANTNDASGSSPRAPPSSSHHASHERAHSALSDASSCSGSSMAAPTIFDTPATHGLARSHHHRDASTSTSAASTSRNACGSETGASAPSTSSPCRTAPTRRASTSTNATLTPGLALANEASSVEEQQEQQQRCETMDLDEREEEEREAYEREERDEDDEDAMEQDERRAPSSKRVRIAAFSAPHGTRSTTESTRGWASSPLALRSAQPHQRHLEPLSGAGASAAPLSSDAAWAPSPALPAGRTSRKIRALEGARAAHDLLRPYSSTRAMGLGSLAGGGDPFIRERRSILQSYVSDHELDAFRCYSNQYERMFAPPFACAFSNGAKQGTGRDWLAVSDEEGCVGLIDAARNSRHDTETGRVSLGHTHHNAVFDVSWSDDDTLLATASGDMSVRLWDVERRERVAQLGGATGTVKQVAWQSPHVLATASRDGTIRVYDKRIGSQDDDDDDEGDSVACVNYIRNAHGARGKRPSRARQGSAVRSVTSLAFARGALGEHTLISAGSADSVLKAWDLRSSYKRFVNPPAAETTELASGELGAIRQHGVLSMALSPDGQTIYAASSDNHIYAYQTLNLSHPAPIATYTHPDLRLKGFYIRIDVSPCSQYLVSGSTDGGVYMWDTADRHSPAVRLEGHQREASAVSFGNDKVASASDDLSVRLWRFDPATSRRLTADSSLAKTYGGACAHS